jgi:hypothetical protein
MVIATLLFSGFGMGVPESGRSASRVWEKLIHWALKAAAESGRKRKIKRKKIKKTDVKSLDFETDTAWRPDLKMPWIMHE